MTEDSIILYVLASITIMLLFAIVVIWFFSHTQKKIIQSKLKEQERELYFQKTLLTNTVKTQESERERIARELHDDVASQLGIIHLNLHLLKSKVESNPELDQFIDHIESSLKNSTERTRNISHELMPAILQKFGFHHAVNELANSVNRTEQLNIKINQLDSIQIKDEFKLLHVYRILQELINNCLKYANAKQVVVSFIQEDQQLTMHYKDDGQGFDIEKQSEGLGISNIKTRIRLLDGDSEWESKPHEGLSVKIRFPNHD